MEEHLFEKTTKKVIFRGDKALTWRCNTD